MADTKYAVKSGFYDSVNHDRLYSADDMNQPYKSMLSAGIIEGGFAVTPQSTPDMTVNVAAGNALLGDKWVDAAAKTLTVPENTALYGRIDAVVLRVDINTGVRAADLIYRTGTPASEPEAPALIGTTGIYEVRLANITVAAGATAIAAAQISDQRGTSGCPYVTMTVGNTQIKAAVEDVLEEHPEWTTTVQDGSITLAKLASGVIDNTLTQAGAAADAKVTGDALTALNNDLETFGKSLTDWESGKWDQYNIKRDNETRVRLSNRVYLIAGERIVIRTTGNQQIALAVFDNQTLLLDSGWNTFYTYLATQACEVCVNLRKSDNSAILPSEVASTVYYYQNVKKTTKEITDNFDYIYEHTYAGKLTITAEDMENGTYDNGYVPFENRCRCSNHYIKAHVGDIVRGYANGTVQVIIGVVDDPDSASPTILYTSGWGYNFEYVNQFEGYYVFLGRNTVSNFTGQFEVISCYDATNAFIEPYFKAEMESTINSVRGLLTEPCIVFPLMTDIHNFIDSHYTFGHMVENMKYFTDKVKCDMLVDLGDNTEGNRAPSATLSAVGQMMAEMRQIGLPVYNCVGNHDDNRYGSTILTLAELYQGYISSAPINDIVFGAMNGTNYYIDFPTFNIRFIFINSNVNGSYGFSSDTIAWVRDVALATPDGYDVAFFTHIAPLAKCNYNNSLPANSDLLEAVIEAYPTEAKKIIAMFYGHSHVDVSFTSPYNLIATNCQKFENENGDPNLWPEGSVKPSREYGTASEDCWDVVIIRPTTGKINLVRFGAGSDREFSY